MNLVDKKKSPSESLASLEEQLFKAESLGNKREVDAIKNSIRAIKNLKQRQLKPPTKRPGWTLAKQAA